MITAEPGTLLAHLCAEIDAMEEGQCLRVELFTLRDIPLTPYMAAEGFKPQDRIMENIVGSAYKLRYTENIEDGSVTFRRVRETGERTYTSPDYRPGGSKYEQLRRSDDG